MNNQTRANSEKFHGFIKFFFNLIGAALREIKNPVKYFYLTGTKQKTNTMNKHYLSREGAEA